MKRLACAVFVLAGTGCFDFERRLAECRDANGAWICGDAGVQTDAGAMDAGGTDAGTEDAGVSDGGGEFPLPDRTGLVCQQGWCWEHPRPSGMEIKTIWGKSRNDFWVGGVGGILAHWDGTSWTSHSLGRDLTVKSLCAHGDDLYVGMGIFGFGASTERLLRYRNAQWENLSSNVDQVSGLSCGSRLLIADWAGLVEMPWTSEMFSRRYDTLPDEICNAVVELSPTECLFSCHESAGNSFTRIRRCDGSVELEFRDGGSDGSRIEALWVDPTRGPLAGVGNAAEVIQQDGGWQAIFSGTATENMNAGTSWNDRSIAVGSYGNILDFTSSGITASQFQAEDNGYLRAVFVPDGGLPIAAGEWGCIIERDGGTWDRRNDCNLNILDLSFGERLLALTDRGVSERTPQGWKRLVPFSDFRLGLRRQADGGLVTLTESMIVLSTLPSADGGVATRQVPLGVNDATAFELIDSARALVVRQSGALLEVTIGTNTRQTTLDGGAVGRPVLDGTGRLWVRSTTGGAWVSTDSGGWTLDPVGDGGVLDDFNVGPGRLWALRGNVVAWRPLGGNAWTEFTALRPFTRLVPLSEDQVLLISGTSEDDLDAILIDTTGLETPITAPPTRLDGPFYFRGGEAWLVGYNGGLLRFKAP